MSETTDNSTTIIIEGQSDEPVSADNGLDTDQSDETDTSELSPPDFEREPSGNEDTEVAVARINAERDIAVAVIASDAERDRNEAFAATVQPEPNDNSDLEELTAWREEMTAQIAELNEKLSLILQPSQEPEIVAEEPAQEIAPETSLIPNDIADPTVSIATELSAVEKELENEPVESLSRVRKYIPI